MSSALLTTRSSKTFIDLVAALRQYRLRENLTYRVLAERIGIGYSNLFYILNSKQPHVNDRTQYRIELFAHQVGLLKDRRAS